MKNDTRTNPLYSENRMKLGAMAFNCSHGSTITSAEGAWEITPQSEQALERGLEWLARNQGADGNWSSNDLGLVSGS